ADGRRALTGSYDHTARLWDVETGRGVDGYELHDKPVVRVLMTRDGRKGLSAGADGVICLGELAAAADASPKAEDRSGREPGPPPWPWAPASPPPRPRRRPTPTRPWPWPGGSTTTSAPAGTRRASGPPRSPTTASSSAGCTSS